MTYKAEIITLTILYRFIFHSLRIRLPCTPPSIPRQWLSFELQTRFGNGSSKKVALKVSLCWEKALLNIKLLPLQRTPRGGPDVLATLREKTGFDRRGVLLTSCSQREGALLGWRVTLRMHRMQTRRDGDTFGVTSDPATPPFPGCERQGGPNKKIESQDISRGRDVMGCAVSPQILMFKPQPLGTSKDNRIWRWYLKRWLS